MLVPLISSVYKNSPHYRTLIFFQHFFFISFFLFFIVIEVQLSPFSHHCLPPPHPPPPQVANIRITMFQVNGDIFANFKMNNYNTGKNQIYGWVLWDCGGRDGENLERLHEGSGINVGHRRMNRTLTGTEGRGTSLPGECYMVLDCSSGEVHGSLSRN